MNTRPIPLRPSHNALVREDRRSAARALTALALSTIRSDGDAARVLHSLWPDDRGADFVLRAATSPAGTAGFPTFTPTTALARLAPTSVALQLFELGLSIDLTGATSVTVPYIATPPAATFIAEGLPAPVVTMGLSGVTVGPVRKILVQAGLTEEIEQATPEAASTVVEYVLGSAIAKAVDAAAFNDVPGDDVQPPGLLCNVTPIVAAPGGGANPLETMAADIGNLAAAITAAGIDASNMVIAAAMTQATRLRLLAGPAFTNSIFGCAALPAGTVVAVAPAGLAVGYSGVPQVSTSKAAAVHFESATPQPIGSAGVVADPTRSAFQTGVIVLRMRAYCAWAVVPGAVQSVENVTW